MGRRIDGNVWTVAGGDVEILPAVLDPIQLAGSATGPSLGALGPTDFFLDFDDPTDFIVTDDDPSPEHEALESEKAVRLRSVIDRLNEREQLILRHRFGLNDGEPRTRVEIGEILGLTPERIGQIERAALCRIRHPSFGLLEKDFD